MRSIGENMKEPWEYLEGDCRKCRDLAIAVQEAKCTLKNGDIEQGAVCECLTCSRKQFIWIPNQA